MVAAGWRFAFAEFFGGVIIIAVVTLGLSLLFGNGQLARLQREYILPLSLSKGQDHNRVKFLSGCAKRSPEPFDKLRTG